MTEEGGDEAEPSLKGFVWGEKAGMAGVDKVHVNNVITELSKRTRYHQFSERQDERVQKRVQKLLAAKEALDPVELAGHQAAADRTVAELEGGRQLNRICCVLDMDMFYAAIVLRSRPELADKPIAVGGMGMISTTNYVARRYGVRAAMPGFMGRVLCPDLIFVQNDRAETKAAAEAVRSILREYDPALTSHTLDEAFLDLTAYWAEHADSGRYASVQDVVSEMRERIKAKTKLTASAGIAPNFRLAKVASNVNKPDGQFCVRATREEVMRFVATMEVRKMGGIGKVAEKTLAGLGIRRCSQLLQARASLRALFSRKAFLFFMECALGLGRCTHHEATGGIARKSISQERTFRALRSRKALLTKCEEISEKVAAAMRKEQLAGRQVTLKTKTADFVTRQRSVTLPRFISAAADIFAAVKPLLLAELPAELRLLGIRLSHFRGADSGQMLLADCFAADDSGEQRAGGGKRAGGREQEGEEEVKAGGEEVEERKQAAKVVAKPRTCPICAAQLPSNNAAVNFHIDRCLAGRPAPSRKHALPPSAASTSPRKRVKRGRQPPPAMVRLDGYFRP
eukprot:PLAT1597.1.p1 GENE.PLAT1597.1~~PLAT1597.1.p1  ORF type:complete len:570 (-),score=258.03 PLAT1597.1:60-1769(-)